MSTCFYNTILRARHVACGALPSDDVDRCIIIKSIILTDQPIFSLPASHTIVVIHTIRVREHRGNLRDGSVQRVLMVRLCALARNIGTA